MGNNLIFRGTGTEVDAAQAAQDIIAGIADSRAQTRLSGGDPLLRLLKTGEWVFGQQSEAVQDGSLWAVNTDSLGHGYVCWGEDVSNGPMGEVMTSMKTPKPQMPPAIGGKPFTEQRLCQMVCLNGDDEGQQVLYKVNSKSGLNEFDKLLASIIAQLKTDVVFKYPVVLLGKDGYQHKQYGWQTTPILQVVNWMNATGDFLRDFGEPAAAAPPTKPVKPQRGAAAAAPPPTRPASPAEATARAAAQPQAADKQAAAAAANQETVAAQPASPPRTGAIPTRQRPAGRAGVVQ